MVLTQTKVIGAGTLILSISLLVGWFISRPDFNTQLSPNITCMGDCVNPLDSDCIQYLNITSTSKKFYIRNKGELNLPFSEPEKVKSFQVYRADLRFKSDNRNRWKAINLSKGMIFQVNQTNEFRINLCKNNPNDDIKWGISGIVNEDPIFFGISVSVIQRCETKTESKQKEITGQGIFLINKNVCSDFPTNKSCRQVNIQNLTYETVTGSYIDLVNTTKCINEGFKINDKIINFTKYGWLNCNDLGKEICCESQHQSNGDGYCQSGEGYCIFDKSNLANPKCTVSKTEQIKELMTE